MTFTLRARVLAGRLMLDEPIALPDGTEVELVLANENDQLDDADRARLHAALGRASEQFARHEGIPAEEVIAKLRGQKA
jgi:hypothetical protein